MSTQTVFEEASAISEQTGMKLLNWISKKNNSIELIELFYFGLKSHQARLTFR
jgi:hypothetical protein